MHNNGNFNNNPPTGLMSYPFPMHNPVQHPTYMEQAYMNHAPQHYQPPPPRFYHPRPPMQAPRPEKRKQEILTCDACGIEVNSQQMMDAHIRGQKHIKKMKLKVTSAPNASNNSAAAGGHADQQSAESTLLAANASADSASRNESNPAAAPAAKSASTNEKSSLQVMNELAKHNKLEAKYDLVKETGPAHAKQFEVKLTVGSEMYTGNGTSIKRAQQDAAEKALVATALRKPETNQRGSHSGRGPRGAVGLGMYSNTRHPHSAPAIPQQQQIRQRSHVPPAGQPQQATNPNSENTLQNLLLDKCAEINEDEHTVSMIQRLVEDTERALKTVSDKIAEQSKQSNTSVVPKLPEHLKSNNAEQTNEDSTESFRMLKGAMKVSTLAMRVFLKTDSEYTLVLICANKPTVALLNEICQELTIGLNAQAIAALQFDSKGDQIDYQIETHIPDACLTVRCSLLPKHTIRIMLTSPVFREENFLSYDEPTRQQIFELNPDPADMLDKNKCLQGAAEIRHSNWFTSCMLENPANLTVLRILRDLQHSQSPLASLNLWCLTLLVYKCQAQPPVSAAGLFRSVFACLSGGILLPAPFGPGIVDPCEKDLTDAAANLTMEQRLSITSYAHQVLRLIAFEKYAALFHPEPSQSEQPTTNPTLGNYPINY